MTPLTVQEVEYIALALARELMDWDEPIPDFDLRFAHRLESCLSAPFQTFDGRELFGSLTQKAAAQFYYMIKSHPFENGNKRLAVTTLLVFVLNKGRKWIAINPVNLYKLAKSIAESQPHESEDAIRGLAALFEGYLVDPSFDEMVDK